MVKYHVQIIIFRRRKKDEEVANVLLDTQHEEPRVQQEAGGCKARPGFQDSKQIPVDDTGVATIQKAVNVVREMSEDERIREMARIREKALHDEVSALNVAERKGIEKTQKKLEPIIEKKDAEVKQLRAEIEALKKQLQQQTKN